MVESEQEAAESWEKGDPSGGWWGKRWERCGPGWARGLGRLGCDAKPPPSLPTRPRATALPPSRRFPALSLNPLHY